MLAVLELSESKVHLSLPTLNIGGAGLQSGPLVTTDVSGTDVTSATSDRPGDRSKLGGMPEVSLFIGMIPKGKLSLIGHFLGIDLL